MEWIPLKGNPDLVRGNSRDPSGKGQGDWYFPSNGNLRIYACESLRGVYFPPPPVFDMMALMAGALRAAGMRGGRLAARRGLCRHDSGQAPRRPGGLVADGGHLG